MISVAKFPAPLTGTSPTVAMNWKNLLPGTLVGKEKLKTMYQNCLDYDDV